MILPQNNLVAYKKFIIQGFAKPEALSLYLIAFDLSPSFVNYLATF